MSKTRAGATALSTVSAIRTYVAITIPLTDPIPTDDFPAFSLYVVPVNDDLVPSKSRILDFNDVDYENVLRATYPQPVSVRLVDSGCDGSDEKCATSCAQGYLLSGWLDLPELLDNGNGYFEIWVENRANKIIEFRFKMIISANDY